MSRPSPFACRGGFDPEGPRGHRAANAFVTEHYPYWDLACRKHDETNGQESYYGYLEHPPGSGRRYGIWCPLEWIPRRAAVASRAMAVQEACRVAPEPAGGFSDDPGPETAGDLSGPLSEPLAGYEQDEPYPF